MLSTIKIAKPFGAVFAHPARMAVTLMGLQIESTMTRTIGQTLTSLFIQILTAGALPTLFAHTNAVHAKSVA